MPVKLAIIIYNESKTSKGEKMNQMRNGIKIGISDFKKLIEGNNYFVDKSILIKEFIENGADIILNPRPR